MNVDLSRSVEQSFRTTLQRAEGLRVAGALTEAAAVYREASHLARQLIPFAVGAAEKARRQQWVRDLETLADRVALQKERTAPIQEPALVEGADLAAQIEALITRAEVSWGDIGGLAATQRALQLAYGLAVAQPPAGVRIDVTPNVLLYGPPGTGKTLLAAAVSSGLNATFFNVGISQVLSKWFGESSRLIVALYKLARQRAPAVVFIDELEALFPSRDGETTGAERRVLSTLLAELSGLAHAGRTCTVFTIGATNAPWLMDPAARTG
jgi:SpoVK/Ycf46/Vps4 family AAA+-type ATPase